MNVLTDALFVIVPLGGAYPFLGRAEVLVAIVDEGVFALRCNVAHNASLPAVGSH